MIVVSDTSVISALIQVGHADLLPEIFGGVVIPERVAEELAVSHPVPLPWLRVMAVRDRSAVAKFAERLDEGESEAIVLAAELEADYLLMDERKGRTVARQAGIGGRIVQNISLQIKHQDA